MKLTSSGGESANCGGAARGGRVEVESKPGPDTELVEASKHILTPRLDWLRGKVRVVVWLN